MAAVASDWVQRGREGLTEDLSPVREVEVRRVLCLAGRDLADPRQQRRGLDSAQRAEVRPEDDLFEPRGERDDRLLRCERPVG